MDRVVLNGKKNEVDEGKKNEEEEEEEEEGNIDVESDNDTNENTTSEDEEVVNNKIIDSREERKREVESLDKAMKDVLDDSKQDLKLWQQERMQKILMDEKKNSIPQKNSDDDDEGEDGEIVLDDDNDSDEKFKVEKSFEYDENEETLHPNVNPILEDLESSRELVEELGNANTKANRELKSLDKELKDARKSLERLSLKNYWSLKKWKNY